MNCHEMSFKIICRPLWPRSAVKDQVQKNVAEPFFFQQTQDTLQISPKEFLFNQMYQPYMSWV